MASNPYGLNPKGPTLHGIDVASPQGHAFDWKHVAADGIRFAWMQVDSTFERNWKLARDVEVLRGPYGFLRADQNPIAQADWLLKKIESDYRSDDLHPMIDVEVMRGMSPQQVLDCAATWIERVRTKLGRPTVWYTFPSFCTNNKPSGLGGLTSPIQEECLLWISHFVVDPNSGVAYKLSTPILPRPWKNWLIWQTSGNKGPRIPGIPIDVDRDVFWGTEDEFRTLFTFDLPTTVREPQPIYEGTPGIVVPEGEHTVKPEDL